MASIFGTSRTLSHGEVSFITRRAAAHFALAAAGVATAVSLAAGIVIGLHLASTKREVVPTKPSLEHDYTIDQLGRLDAQLSQLGPRIERLGSQVDALGSFQSRLGGKAPAATSTGAQRLALSRRMAAAAAAASASAAAGGTGSGAALRARDPNAASSAQPGNPDTASDDDGEGGPLLPPRPCPRGTWLSAHLNAAATQQQIDCLSVELSLLEQLTSQDALAYTAFPGRMPVDGARLGSPFGNRIDPFTGHLSFHPGVDLVAPSGTPILATAGGRVVFAGEKTGYGNAVEIDHGNGLMTRYGHASKLLVKAGDIVLPRQPIALVGTTGRSTGPHLHFEVLINGSPVDPTAYLALFGAYPHG